MKKITLEPLKAEDINQFVLDNQEAFRYGALEEFGLRDNHFEEEGEIISRATIEKAISEGDAYRILCDGKVAGGVVVRINGDKAVWNLSLFLRVVKARVSVMPHGVRSSECTRR